MFSECHVSRTGAPLQRHYQLLMEPESLWRRRPSEPPRRHWFMYDNDCMEAGASYHRDGNTVLSTWERWQFTVLLERMLSYAVFPGDAQPGCVSVSACVAAFYALLGSKPKPKPKPSLTPYKL